MGVGGQLEGQGGLLHVVVYVVDYHPKPAPPCLVLSMRPRHHLADQPRRQVSSIHLVDGQDRLEIDRSPLVDVLVEAELELEGVVALEFSDPDQAEGDRTREEAGGVGVGGIDHLFVAAEPGLDGAGR